PPPDRPYPIQYCRIKPISLRGVANLPKGDSQLVRVRQRANAKPFLEGGDGLALRRLGNVRPVAEQIAGLALRVRAPGRPEGAIHAGNQRQRAQLLAQLLVVAELAEPSRQKLQETVAGVRRQIGTVLQDPGELLVKVGVEGEFLHTQIPEEFGASAQLVKLHKTRCLQRIGETAGNIESGQRSQLAADWSKG